MPGDSAGNPARHSAGDSAEHSESYPDRNLPSYGLSNEQGNLEKHLEKHLAKYRVSNPEGDSAGYLAGNPTSNLVGNLADNLGRCRSLAAAECGSIGFCSRKPGLLPGLSGVREAKLPLSKAAALPSYSRGEEPQINTDGKEKSEVDCGIDIMALAYIIQRA